VRALLSQELLDGGPDGALSPSTMVSPVYGASSLGGGGVVGGRKRSPGHEAAACALPPSALRPRLVALHSTLAVVLTWWALHSPSTRAMPPALAALVGEGVRALVALAALLKAPSAARLAALGPRWALASAEGAGGPAGVAHLAAAALASVATSVLLWRGAAHCDVRALQ
jgi:hypothetical protein